MNHHFHAYMDFSQLSEQELTDRIMECRDRASRVAHNPDLQSSIYHMLDCLETELHLRRHSEAIKESQNEQSEVIEIGHIDDISDQQ